MAKPLEFEYVLRCADAEGEYEKLLSTAPSRQAVETLKRVEEMRRERRRETLANGDNSEEP